MLDKKVCKEQQEEQQQQEEEGFEWICYSAGAEWKTSVFIWQHWVWILENVYSAFLFLARNWSLKYHLNSNLSLF